MGYIKKNDERISILTGTGSNFSESWIDLKTVDDQSRSLGYGRIGYDQSYLDVTSFNDVNIWTSNKRRIEFSDTTSVTVNPVNEDYDFIVNGISSSILKTDAQNGRVGIGNISPSYQLDVQNININSQVSRLNSDNSEGDYVVEITNLSETIDNNTNILRLKTNKPEPLSGDVYIGFQDGENTLDGSITSDGAGGVRYNTTSDKRLKENIIDTTSVTSELMKLKVRDYNMIGSNTKQIGFIAQELNEVCPSAVTKTDNGIEENFDNPWGVDYSKLVPILVKVTQDQEKQISDLKSEIDKLKG